MLHDSHGRYSSRMTVKKCTAVRASVLAGVRAGVDNMSLSLLSSISFRWFWGTLLQTIATNMALLMFRLMVMMLMEWIRILMGTLFRLKLITN